MRNGCSYFLNFTLLVGPCLLVGSPGNNLLGTFFSNRWPGNLPEENVCDVGNEIVTVINSNNSVQLPEYGSNDEIRAFIGSKEHPSYNRVALQGSSITLSRLKKINPCFYTSMNTRSKQTINIKKDGAIPPACMAESTTVYTSTSLLISLEPFASSSRGERYWATLYSSDIITLSALLFAAVLSISVILETQFAKSRKSMDKHSGMVHRTSQNKISLFIRMMRQILLVYSTMVHVGNASAGFSTNNGTSSIYKLNANRSKHSSIFLLPLTISSFSSTRSAVTNAPDSINYRRSSAESHFMRMTAKSFSLGSSIIEMPSLLASIEFTTSIPRNPPQSEKILHSGFSHTTTGLMSARRSFVEVGITKSLSNGINTTLLMTTINKLLLSDSSSPKNETSALSEAGYGTLTPSPAVGSNTRIYSSTLLATNNAESDLFRSAVEHKSTQVKPAMNEFSPTIQFFIAASTYYKDYKLSNAKFYGSVMLKPESLFSSSSSSLSLLASLLSSSLLSPSLLSSLSKSMVAHPTASFVSDYGGSSPDFKNVLTKPSLSGSSNSGTDALTSFVELTSLHQILLSQSKQSLHSRPWQTVMSFASNGSSYMKLDHAKLSSVWLLTAPLLAASHLSREAPVTTEFSNEALAPPSILDNISKNTTTSFFTISKSRFLYFVTKKVAGDCFDSDVMKKTPQVEVNVNGSSWNTRCLPPASTHNITFTTITENSMSQSKDNDKAMSIHYLLESPLSLSSSPSSLSTSLSISLSLSLFSPTSSSHKDQGESSSDLQGLLTEAPPFRSSTFESESFTSFVALSASPATIINENSTRKSKDPDREMSTSPLSSRSPNLPPSTPSPRPSSLSSLLPSATFSTYLHPSSSCSRCSSTSSSPALASTVFAPSHQPQSIFLSSNPMTLAPTTLIPASSPGYLISSYVVHLLSSLRRTSSSSSYSSFAHSQSKTPQPQELFTSLVKSLSSFSSAFSLVSPNPFSSTMPSVSAYSPSFSASLFTTPTIESLTRTVSLSSSSLLSSNKSSSTTYLTTLSIFSAGSLSSSSSSLFFLPSKLLSYSSLQSSLILPVNLMSSSSQYFTSFSLPFMGLSVTPLLPVVSVLVTLLSLPSSSLPLQTVLFTLSSLPARSLSSSSSPLYVSTSSSGNTESTPLQLPASSWSLSEGSFLVLSSPSLKSVASHTFSPQTLTSTLPYPSFISTLPSSISSSSPPSKLLSASSSSLQLSSSSPLSPISLPLSSTQSMAVGLLPTVLTPASPNSRSLLLISSTSTMSSAMSSSPLHMLSQYPTSNSSTPSLFSQLSLPLLTTSMAPITTTLLSKTPLPLSLFSLLTPSLLSLVSFTLPTSVTSKAAASTSLSSSMVSVVTSPLVPLSFRTSLMTLPSVLQIPATPSSRSRLSLQSASSLSLSSSSISMSKVVRSISSPVESASGTISFFSEKPRSRNSVPHSDVSKTSSIIATLSLSSTANGEHVTASIYIATSSVSLQIFELIVVPSSSLALASLPSQFVTSSSLSTYSEVSLSDTSSTTTFPRTPEQHSLERQKSTFTTSWPSQVSSVITTLWTNSTISLKGSSDLMNGPDPASSVTTSSTIKHNISPIGPNETRTINVSVPLLNILFHEDLLNESSQQFLDLSEKVNLTLWELFSSNIKGFRELQNLRFRQGSVRAVFNLLISSSSNTTTQDVNRTLSNNNGTNSHGLLFGKAVIREKCSPGLCTNLGRCQEGASGAFCSCITGYEGLRCEKTTAPVDGNYTNWSEFTECSKSCEPGGRKSRKRSCSNPSPQHGGKDCSGLGSDIEYAVCNGDVRCPVSTWIWIVVGVSCGLLLLILIVVIVLCLRRRKKQSENRDVVSASADSQANGHTNIIPLEVIYEDKTLLSSTSKGQTNPEFIGDDEDDDNDIYKAQLLLFLKQSHLIRPDLYNNDDMSDTSDGAPSRKASAVTTSSDRDQEEDQTEPVDITSIQVDDISPSKDGSSYKNKETSLSTEL